MMTKRRLIRKADEARVLESLRACAAVKGEPHLYWGEGAIHLIEIPENCGLSATEIVALAAVGIHAGADGWEIEEAPANARSPLPPAFGWYQRGVDSYSLDGPDGKPIATARKDLSGHGWIWALTGAALGRPAITLLGAKDAAEDACRDAGLFGAPTAPDLGAKVDALHDAAGAPPTGAARTLMTLLLRATSLGEMPGTQPTLAERLDAMGRLCGAFVAELRASLPAPPMPAPRTTDGALPLRECKGDGRLTEYLIAQYPEAWPSNLSAVDFAIRLLGTQSHAIDMVGESLKEAREEARVTDESNAELAAELGKVRGELHAARHHVEGAKRREAEVEAESLVVARERDEARATLALEEARRIEAERGRGEALGDLATVRNDVLKTAADLAAKMGAPHG